MKTSVLLALAFAAMTTTGYAYEAPRGAQEQKIPNVLVVKVGQQQATGQQAAEPGQQQQQQQQQQTLIPMTVTLTQDADGNLDTANLVAACDELMGSSEQVPVQQGQQEQLQNLPAQAQQAIAGQESSGDRVMNRWGWAPWGTGGYYGYGYSPYYYYPAWGYTTYGYTYPYTWAYARPYGGYNWYYYVR